MIELHNLRPSKGSRKERKRVGRGPGSGTGKTAGSGENGQKSRSGGKIPAYFEGGQMPLQRRIPKRGFTPLKRVVYQVVNVGRLDRVEGSEVTPESLRACGLVRSRKTPVKILGQGDVEGKYTVKVHAISDAAKGKIESAGGSVELLG